MNGSDSKGKTSLYSINLAVLVVLTILAFSTRAVPYSISPLPFNNDGMTEARIASDILSSGHLSYPEGSFYADTYSVITPVYNVLLAFLSSATGFDTLTMSQAMVGVFSILTVLGGYIIALRMTKSLVGSISTAFILSFLGTFVFLSGSSWKASLGVSLLIFLTYAYMRRTDKRFLVLELIVLASLPLTYHLVTVLAYLFLAYLTIWSVMTAVINRRITKAHLIDVAIVLAVSIMAYIYYLETSFQRLSEYSSTVNLLLMMASFMALTCGAAFFLMREKDLKFSLAPVAGAAVATAAFIDYYNPMFPYTQGYSVNVVLLGFIYGLIVTIGWYGFERLIRSSSRYRAIPLGLLLSVLTLLLFALISGFDLEGHKVFYRTFDSADISRSLGAGVAVASMSHVRIRKFLIIGMVLVLVLSFPFAYATQTLLGDRHDSQEYEVDALSWVHEIAYESMSVRSDERLSYNARALFDIVKDPYLPSRFVVENPSAPDVMNIYLEEWTDVGVNDYPRGHPVLDGAYVSAVLDVSNVVYVGGPASNNIIVFQTTTVTS